MPSLSLRGGFAPIIGTLISRAPNSRLNVNRVLHVYVNLLRSLVHLAARSCSKKLRLLATAEEGFHVCARFSMRVANGLFSVALGLRDGACLAGKSAPVFEKKKKSKSKLRSLLFLFHV